MAGGGCNYLFSAYACFTPACFTAYMGVLTLSLAGVVESTTPVYYHAPSIHKLTELIGVR